MTSWHRHWLWLWTLCVVTASVSHARPIDHEAAHLRVLDKVAGDTQLLAIAIGDIVSFRSIQLLVLACYTQPPEKTPESAAWIEVYKDDEALFKGWMFASSPALSSMEHDVYDVWLVDCAKMDKTDPDN